MYVGGTLVGSFTLMDFNLFDSFALGGTLAFVGGTQALTLVGSVNLLTSILLETLWWAPLPLWDPLLRH